MAITHGGRPDPLVVFIFHRSDDQICTLAFFGDFLNTASSFWALAQPQTISGTSMAARTFLTVAAASSGLALFVLGSTLFS